LTIHEVDDPVESDSASAVHPAHHVAIVVEAGIRHLDHENHVSRIGIAPVEVTNFRN
jgi:hypothetical protein